MSDSTGTGPVPGNSAAIPTDRAAEADIQFQTIRSDVRPIKVAARGSDSAAAADTAMENARAAVRRGDFAGALIYLRPYADRPESFPALYSDYLSIQIWAGRPQDAIGRFEALPPTFPRRSYLLRNMAKAYLDRGDVERAAGLYEQAAGQTPEDVIALEGWIEALLAAGHFDRAGHAWEKAAPFAGKSQRLGVLGGRLLIAQERYSEALAWYDLLMARMPEHAAAIAQARDDLIAGMPVDRQERLLAVLASAAADRTDRPAAQHYALCLVLARRHQAAVDYLDAARWEPAGLSSERLYWFAWAHFKVGRSADALERFNLLLSRDADDLRSRIGRIYCFAALKDFGRAGDEIRVLESAVPGNGELLYAQAFVYERQGRYWDAVRIYDQLLARTPGEQTAMRLKLRALSDLGATSVAARLSDAVLPSEQVLRDTFRQDEAVDRIRWQENPAAVKRLEDLAAQDGRFAYDHIIALTRAEHYSQAIDAYERMIAEGASPPDWVRSAVAGAYLAEERPEQALELYEQVLARQADSRDARLGKLYVLQTLRRWKEADAWLAYLDSELPATITVGDRTKPNPEKFELAVIKAWYLAYQDRLVEAEAAFRELQAEAPANLGVRNGLAHIYLWRGWPRRSLQAFDIIDTMEPTYAPAQSGRAMALNRLAEKEKARAVAAALLQKKPHNKTALQTMRSLAVEQMKTWRTEIYGQREDDQSYDTRIRTEISAPLALRTRLLGYLLWRRTWVDGESAADDATAYFRRVGVGLDHIFNADWRIRPALSIDYDDAEDTGAAVRVDYTPTDHWAFGLFGDTFSTEVARRARAAGIDAALIGADAVFRPSEWRQAGLSFTRSFFSDDNARDELSVGYQQNLWVKHDWRMRVYLDLYTTWNSKGDETAYFNPEQAWALSLTHMTEQTVWNMYQRAFVHRLYVSAGTYRQTGFGGDLIASLRYEQSHAFNDRHGLEAGISLSRNVYDGEAVSDVRFDMEYQWRF